MKEVQIKESNGKKIFVDELPQEEFIPPSVLDIFVMVLGEEIEKIVKEKKKRKTYYQNSKEKKSNKKVS